MNTTKAKVMVTCPKCGRVCHLELRTYINRLQNYGASYADYNCGNHRFNWAVDAQGNLKTWMAVPRS